MARSRVARGGVHGTDDAMLVERMAREVCIVESPGPNLKVTTPGDLPVVRALLRSGGRS